MSAHEVLARWLAVARRRRVAIVLAIAGLPLLALLAVIARHAPAQLVVASAAVVAALTAMAAQRWSSLDAATLVRRLDATAPRFDDSSALLLRTRDSLGPLESLQRARLEQRLAEAPRPELRDAWPRRALWLAAAVALVLLGVAALPLRVPQVAGTPATTSTPAATIAVAVRSARIAIAPPAYTGAPARSVDGLDARAEAGARLAWSLDVAGAPRTVLLRFIDGSALPLQLANDRWSAERVLAESTLYRVVTEPPLAAGEDALHRLEAIPDRAPAIQVTEPERTLTLLAPGQRNWTLAFEADDDYGLGAARAEVTLAQGGGENVTVSQRTIALRGEGDALRRRYRHVFDLAALGLAEGDDLIVRVRVADNRAPAPNEARSSSFILRWTKESGDEGSGVEGLVRKSLPAYFRSQRQIIIDTEALIAQQPSLAKDVFVDKSDAIGNDQRLLRLRYGQFLGEEQGHGAPHAPGSLAAPSHDDDEATAMADRETPGESQAVLEAFGHTHDIAGAATLFDPETRALLKDAIDAMWQAEGELRLGNAQAALPHEYHALERIKQVQQASRIYLARVGVELPAIDPERRLTGDRSTARSPGDPLVDADRDDAVLLGAWRAGASDEQAIAALTAWIPEHRAALPNALSLLAALDRVQRAPDCGECRAALRAELWPLLPVAAPRTATRTEPDAAGRAYLDALAEPAR